MKRPAVQWLLLVLAGIIPAAVAQAPPNILLLVAEDLSPRLGGYGDPVADTPSLDALAAQAVRYTRAYTTAGVCAPSRAALITGQHQISFAAQHMRTSSGPLGPYLARPGPEVRAFPELLRQAGYYTFTDRKLDYQFSGVTAGSGPFSIWDAEGAADTAWRQRRGRQPFFGMINFLETHESGVMRPTGPPHSDTHQQTQQMRQAFGLVAKAVTEPARVILPPYYPDLPEVRRDLARHYDNIHRMDQRVGRILGELATDGLLHNTVVIWTSDHGDGLPRAKRELYESGLRVPLLVRLPAALRQQHNTAAPGATDTRLVSFVDLAPTILTLAGVPRPPYLHGHNIFQSQRRHIFAGRDRIDEVTDRQRAVSDGEFKYIHSWHPGVAGGHALAYRDNLDMVRAMRRAYLAEELNPAQQRWFQPAGTEQLYHLPSDPHELTNLAMEPQYQAHKARLQDVLQHFLLHIGDTGAIAEAQLRESLLLEDAIPQTPPPQVRLGGSSIRLTHPLGSSTGYRFAGEDPWRLYTGTLQTADIPSRADAIEVKSVRYGWRESTVVRKSLADLSHK